MRSNSLELTAASQSGQPNAIADRLRIAVGIATLGRHEVLAETLARLAGQSRPPDRIVVCSPTPDDVAGISESFPDVELVTNGPRGLPHQRNDIIRRLDGSDVVVFLDDDFFVHADYLAQIETVMLAHPDIAMVTGNVLADGVTGPGLSYDEADAAIDAAPRISSGQRSAIDVYNGYGCNMSARLAPMQANAIYFEEDLPLYAWLEDVDFSRCLALFGRIVKIETAMGVHLGVKGGRQPGVRLGYSQIANPVFLIRKGTCSWRKGLFLICRNLAANTVRSFCPEPWVDRRGRLMGNIAAIRDLVLGRISPDRILSM